jgi:hypothetical protein
MAFGHLTVRANRTFITGNGKGNNFINNREESMAKAPMPQSGRDLNTRKSLRLKTSKRN